MRKSLTLVLCILLICSMIIPVSLGYNVRNNAEQQPSIFGNGNTLYVGGSGPNNYTTIQSAIDNASDGDTVYVFDDSSPYEELLVIDKSISLIGEDRESTVVDGRFKGTVVDIKSDDVLVSGFTLKNCNRVNDFQYNVVKIIGFQNNIIKNNIISLGPWDLFPPSIAGIYIKDSSDNLIQNNIIIDDSNCGRTNGIVIYWGSASNNNLSGNDISDFSNGIYLLSGDNVVFGNYLHHNGDGIENRGDRNEIINNLVKYNPHVGIQNFYDEHTVISDNIISNNGGGSEFNSGLSFSGSENNIVINNQISNNNPTGIYILGDKNYIKNNHISDNAVLGIYLLTNNNEITDNQIKDNGEYGIGVDFAYYNTIRRNNLIDNGKNAYIEISLFGGFSNNWNGNYWSDYTGTGSYVISGKVRLLLFFHFFWFNLDRNPAMEPYDIGGLV